MSITVDVVSELINRMLDAANREGGLTESLAREVERAFRHEFSGEKFYVKREPTPKKTAAVTDYLSGQPLEQITKHHGISRATLYRHMKRS